MTNGRANDSQLSPTPLIQPLLIRNTKEPRAQLINIVFRFFKVAAWFNVICAFLPFQSRPILKKIRYSVIVGDNGWVELIDDNFIEVADSGDCAAS